MKKGIVIFTGYNTRAVVSFCRFLKLHGLRAHLIAINSKDPIFLTDYSEWVHSTRESLDLEINRCIEYFKIIKKDFDYHSLMLAPTSEYLNRFFLSNNNIIEKEMVSIPLVNIASYKRISDKYSFRNLCREYGLAVPHLVNHNLDKFPFVAKKKVYDACPRSQAKPYLIFNELDHKKFSENEIENDFYFERLIEGESNYLFYYVSPSGLVLSHSQQNLIQQANGKSIIAARPSGIHNEPIGKQYSDLFLSLNFHGLVMVEVRKYRNRYYMIEANPRFWGPLQFVVDNQPSMIKQFLLDQGISTNGEAKYIDRKTDCYNYFWYGGYVLDKIKGNSPTFHQYDESVFNEALPNWMSADVFLQKDSIQLFRSEIEGKISS